MPTSHTTQTDGVIEFSDAMESVVSNPTTGTVSPVVIFLSFFLLGAVLYFRRPSNVPPGPFIPFGLLFRRQNAYINLTKFSHEYGPIYSFRLTGRMLTVVINSASLVREALVDQADIFSDRSVSGAVLLRNGGAKGSILFGNGEEWKELRRFGSHALRSFGVGKRSLGRKIHEEARHLVNAILSLKGNPFDPVHVISNAVSNIICSISFGDRYEYDDPNFQKLLYNLRCLTSQTPGILPQLFPYVIYLPPYRRNLKRNIFLRTFIEDVVEEHRASLDPNDVRDIIDMFLLEVDKGKVGDNGVIFDKSRVWRTIFDLFGAGTDTTSNSLLWAIAIFCHYPDVQKKMYEEITRVVGSEKFPVYEDRFDLPYTEAVILEVQRFRPVAPLVPHGAKQSTTLGGYHIPKGSRLLVNLWATHHDPQEWKDPERFHPERFLDDNGNVIHPEAHTPFSMGRRICLGESLAKMELFLFLTCLVQRFRFFVPDGHELPSLNGIHGVTLSPVSYKICAEPIGLE